MPKTLTDIITELQALDSTSLDAVVAGLNQAITDLQALGQTTAPAADPVVSITATLQSGATVEFVPQQS